MTKNAPLNRILKRLRSPSKLVLLGLNFFLYYFLWQWTAENVRLASIFDYLRQIPIWALLGSLLINLLSLVLSGIRMASLLKSKFQPAFSIINIGYALNALFPLRLGEPVKLYLSHKHFGIPLTSIFAASVAEKLIDLIILMLLSIVIAAFAINKLGQTTTLLSIGILASLCISGIVIFQRNVAQVVRLLPRRSRLRRISIELHKHASGYSLWRVMAISIFIWILHIALILFTFNTYLSEVHVGLLDSIALLVLIALAIAIPSAPAGIGIFEGAIVAYLAQQSIGSEAALAAATVFHLVITLPQLVMAALLLWNPIGQAVQVNLEHSPPP